MSQSSIATPPGGRDEYSTRLWIAGLSDDDVIRLHSNSYGPIYANMLLMFSQTRPLGAIKKLAIQCTRWAIWEREAVERHILSLAEAASLNTPAICLKGWDPILLHSLLQRKKGLILCSIRMGPYRFLPLEAALQGLNVWTPMNPRGCASINSKLDFLRQRLSVSAAGQNSGAPFFAENVLRWKLLGHDEPGVSGQLLTALKRNEVVVLFIDAPSRFEHRWVPMQIPIQFFGMQTRVDDLIARLAWHSGAPVLPTVAVMEGNEPGRILYGAPWLASEIRRPGSEQDFTFDITSALYSFLEGQIKLYPEQWLGVRMLRTWWLPEIPSLN